MIRIARENFDELLDNEHLAAYKLLHAMAVLLADRQRTTTLRLSELLKATELTEVHEGIKGLVGESSIRE